MARPRSFDSDAVLAAAQDLFHARGYEGTSIQDLVDVTGLGRSSLYAAFGDKHGLYLAVLDRYADAGQRITQDLCEGMGPIAAIRAMLEIAAQPVSTRARGCLLVNVTAEVADWDSETARRADTAREAQNDLFSRLVLQAQEAGDADSDRPAEALAQFLTGVTYGLRGLQSAGAPDADLAAVVQQAMTALRPA